MATSFTTINVSLTDQDRQLVETAARRAGTSLTEFMRRSAIDAAELEIMDRRIVTIPTRDWEKLEAWACKPPRAVQALAALAAKKTS